ncbi:hypothetical protein B0A49_08887 [Cryomyces minteri]|uniref:Uncharacterized protein n=1 Tax=Cryomyces minteri TaxID=331657 RepID=A0A4U0WIZ0_9PEZI|nr:hypothetical protein B0A49_08887 [Cryomyces minteri]
MKVLIMVLALVVGTHGLMGRTASCCFGLTADGGPGGSVGQLADGHNRFGQGLNAASYCIDNGAITDSSGRGCILTPPTTQFQCDVGATPASGFSVGCDGRLEANGSTKFVACPTEDNGGYNIYTAGPANQQGCVAITLTADNCKTGCPAPPPAPAPTPKTCPPELTGNWEYPHLIVPVDSSKPDTALGTSYNGTISSKISSIYNFDVPAADTGKTCSLVFLLPKKTELETSDFTLSGTGAIDFGMLSSAATAGTTYDSIPSTAKDYGVTTVVPGNAYTIATFPCPAGERVSYKASAKDNTCLNYFQDYNPSPIGLYITVC